MRVSRATAETGERAPKVTEWARLFVVKTFGLASAGTTRFHVSPVDPAGGESLVGDWSLSGSLAREFVENEL